MPPYGNGMVMAAFVAIVVLLGVNFVAVKFSNIELAPFWGAAFRFLIASAVLITIALARRLPLPRSRGLLAACAYGALVFFATYGLLYWALLFVSSSTSSVLFATIPLITLLIASVIGLEKITARGLIGAGLVVAGIAVIFSQQLAFDVPLLPLVAVALAAFCAALSGIVVKLAPDVHPVTMNVVGMAVGAFLLLGLSATLGETLAVPTLARTWIALGWLVMSSIVAFLLLVWVIGKWSASRASYTGVLPPIVTIPVASVLIGETIGPVFLAGTFIVLAGVYIGALRPHASADTTARHE